MASVEELNRIQTIVKQQMDILAKRFNQQVSILRTDIDELKGQKRNLEAGFRELHEDSMKELELLLKKNEELLPVKQKYDTNIERIGIVNHCLNQNLDIDEAIIDSMKRDVVTLQEYCNSVNINEINKELETNIARLEKINSRIAILVNLLR